MTHEGQPWRQALSIEGRSVIKDRLKKLGQQFLGEQKAEKQAPEPAVERRAGRRIRLPIAVRFRTADGSTQVGKVRDVNLTGLSIETAEAQQVGNRLSIGFEGYPDVCPAFVLFGEVRRIVTDPTSGAPTAMGVEIDRATTSPDALKDYRSLVLHYLHHKPLLDDIHKGYFEGRCPSCDWVGRVGERNPVCSRCGTKVLPVQSESR